MILFCPDLTGKEEVKAMLIGNGNRDYFKDRIGRGCKTRRCGLPDGCGIPDTVICGVFGLDCAKDSEVG